MLGVIRIAWFFGEAISASNRVSLTIGVSWSSFTMAPSQSKHQSNRVLQPSHLSVDDAWRVLMEAYSDDDLAMIRAAESNPECDSKLAFEYNHGKFGGDKDALYKYRKVIKAFTDINKIGVWNWTVILGAVRKWDAKSLCKILSTSKSFGGRQSGNQHRTLHRCCKMLATPRGR